MNSKVNSIKKNKPKAGRRGLRGSSLAAVLAEGILSAALMFGLGACDGLSGLPEDINNNNADALLNAIDLTLSSIAMTSKTWTWGSDEDLPTLYAFASLKAANGEITFQWMKSVDDDPDHDVPVPPDTPPLKAMPGVTVKYQLTSDDLPSDEPEEDQPVEVGFYVIARYLNKEKVSDMAVVKIVAPGFERDSDDDGYPDAWEEEPEHQREGYDPNCANQPYGIDLSRGGAVPDGVNLVYVNSDPTNKKNVYTVYGVPSEGINAYKVYYSDDDRKYVGHIHLAAAVDDNDLSRTTVKLIISDDVNELYITSSSNQGSGAGLVIARGANVTITLNGVQLKGGAPIDFEVDNSSFEVDNSSFEVDNSSFQADATLTLLLQDISTLTAGSVYSDAEKCYVATAGIHVPAGAKLIIDSAASTETAPHSTNGTLYVSGFTGKPTNETKRLGSFGSGAGIGGGNNYFESNYDTGEITISGGTIDATGGGVSEGNGAAGIGGGYNCDSGNITISGGSVTATGVGKDLYGVGPGTNGTSIGYKYNGGDDWPTTNPYPDGE